MKLYTKFLFAFVITTALTILFAMFLIHELVIEDFEEHVTTQYYEEYRFNMISYYQNDGTLDTFTPRVIARRPPDQPPPNDAVRPLGQEARRSAGRPIPGAEPIPNYTRIVPFIMADKNYIVRDAGPRSGVEVGQPVPELLMENISEVVYEGEVIGYITYRDEDVNITEGQLFIDRLDNSLQISALSAILLGIIGSIIMSRLLTQPIEKLTRGVQSIASGKFGEQIDIHSDDEIGILAREFNDMSVQLAEANAMREAITADIAHDLNKPLTVISGYVEAMQQGELQPTEKRLRSVYEQVRVMNRLVTDLEQLHRLDKGSINLQQTIVQPRMLFDQIENFYKSHAEEMGIEFSTEAPMGLPSIRVDVAYMVRVLGNLMDNALRYTEEGESIRLKAYEDTGYVVIECRDTGTGISEEDIGKIFERFYRADKSRSGRSSGLGLSITRSIVQAHGGNVTVESQVGRGTTFFIRLPITYDSKKNSDKFYQSINGENGNAPSK